jgi:hypothetical protein
MIDCFLTLGHHAPSKQNGFGQETHETTLGQDFTRPTFGRCFVR